MAQRKKIRGHRHHPAADVGFGLIFIVSAGAIASAAVQRGTAPARVDYSDVRTRLLARHAKL